mgnify:CR=1 FL=1
MAGKNEGDGLIAQNRRARHDYFIEDTVEAGIVLVGSEVKSLRDGKASIGESYAGQDRGELTLFNAHIPEYPAAAPFNHEPRRPRRLLVHRKERDRLLGRGNARPATALFQRSRHRQGGDRDRDGQEEDGQARDREEAGLAARQGAPDAREELTRQLASSNPRIVPKTSSNIFSVSLPVFVL